MNMSSEYKIQKQGQQETAIVVRGEETSLIAVMCDPYNCGRSCGNRPFMASYNERGLLTPKAPCMPNDVE